MVYANSAAIALFDELDPAELFITSGATFIADKGPENSFSLEDVKDVWVLTENAQGEKCERCWKVLPDVGADKDHPGTCGRCADAVRHSAP